MKALSPWVIFFPPLLYKYFLFRRSSLLWWSTKGPSRSDFVTSELKHIQANFQLFFALDDKTLIESDPRSFGLDVQCNALLSCSAFQNISRDNYNWHVYSWQFLTTEFADARKFRRGNDIVLKRIPCLLLPLYLFAMTYLL